MGGRVMPPRSFPEIGINTRVDLVRFAKGSIQNPDSMHDQFILGLSVQHFRFAAVPSQYPLITYLPSLFRIKWGSVQNHLAIVALNLGKKHIPIGFK